jgi:hypothetical protein
MAYQVNQFLAVRACRRVDYHEINLARRMFQAILECGDCRNLWAVIRASLKPVQAGLLWIVIRERYAVALIREI